MSFAQSVHHAFGKPREILCLVAAALLPAPILWWQARPDTGVTSDPIIGVDFVVEEDPKDEPPPPVKAPEPVKPTFFQKVQKSLGLATKPAPVEKLLAEPAKPALAGTTSAGPITTAKRVESILGSDKLTDKTRTPGTLSGTISVANIKSQPTLAGGGLGTGPIKEGGRTLKTKGQENFQL